MALEGPSGRLRNAQHSAGALYCRSEKVAAVLSFSTWLENSALDSDPQILELESLFLPFSFFVKFIGVTLVSKIIKVSNAHFCDLDLYIALGAHLLKSNHLLSAHIIPPDFKLCYRAYFLSKQYLQSTEQAEHSAGTPHPHNHCLHSITRSAESVLVL